MQITLDTNHLAVSVIVGVANALADQVDNGPDDVRELTIYQFTALCNAITSRCGHDYMVDHVRCPDTASYATP